MYCCLRLIYTRCDYNEWKTGKRHECANMGKIKRLELWWKLYHTSLPVWDLENFRPMDFCWHECMSESRLFTHYLWNSLNTCRHRHGHQLRRHLAEPSRYLSDKQTWTRARCHIWGTCPPEVIRDKVKLCSLI